MSSLQAALRTAGFNAPELPLEQQKFEAPKHHEVTKRALLWSGVVEYNIPRGGEPGQTKATDARLVTIELPAGPLTYIQFAKTVRGKVFVNTFVHGDDPAQHIGKTIKARAEVMRKTMDDGRAFVYLDLHPVTDDSTPTHRVAIMDLPMGGKFHPDVAEEHIFRTPSPGEGAIVVVKAGGKFVGVCEPVKRDAHLQARLDDGWVIEKEDDRVAHIRRGKKTLVHHKPR